jgi:hypothetical protein
MPQKVPKPFKKKKIEIENFDEKTSGFLGGWGASRFMTSNFREV